MKQLPDFTSEQKDKLIRLLLETVDELIREVRDLAKAEDSSDRQSTARECSRILDCFRDKQRIF